MNEFYIVIEKVPGDGRFEEYFSYECEDVPQAWDYARDKARLYGPGARVKEVRELIPIREERKKGMDV